MNNTHFGEDNTHYSVLNNAVVGTLGVLIGVCSIIFAPIIMLGLLIGGTNNTDV